MASVPGKTLQAATVINLAVLYLSLYFDTTVSVSSKVRLYSSYRYRFQSLLASEKYPQLGVLSGGNEMSRTHCDTDNIL